MKKPTLEEISGLVTFGRDEDGKLFVDRVKKAKLVDKADRVKKAKLVDKANTVDEAIWVREAVLVEKADQVDKADWVGEGRFFCDQQKLR